MMDALTIVFKAVDLPLAIGIVLLIQILKKVAPKKFPQKAWLIVLIVAGFGAAWLKVNITQVGYKPFITQGIIYTAAAEFIYQLWRTFVDIKAKRKQ